ncbi:MAG TPA: type II toxin-antitoxin system death-on-curing family toxin [Xanthobacteraceae bacterium]|nr:type II toxin-antitoxin system death-on-curing family toxin [Xanthobacteraceae bacterium]
MTEPIWLQLEVILAAHDEQLAEHGGGVGLRDQTLLESALARPLNLFHYGKPSLSELAAAYAFGIARNHPFVDGNKRTALVAAEAFLGLNGFDLTAGDAEVVKIFLALAAGDITEKELAAWIGRNSRRREP